MRNLELNTAHSSPFSDLPALSEPQYTTPGCYVMHPPSLKPGTVDRLLPLLCDSPFFPSSLPLILLGCSLLSSFFPSPASHLSFSPSSHFCTLISLSLLLRFLSCPPFLPLTSALLLPCRHSYSSNFPSSYSYYSIFRSFLQHLLLHSSFTTTPYFPDDYEE